MTTRRHVTTSILVLALATVVAFADEEPPAMYANTPDRNMVSDAEGLPTTWNLKTGENVKWTQPLGSQSYAGPVIHGGKVFVGTNNEGKRNPAITGDRGNVMAFDLETGEFLWQSAWPKLPTGRVNDWPLQGVCSTPVIDGDRLYYMSNRAEIIAADVDGFRDGQNDGPYVDETNKGETDEDVIWKYDMIDELDVFPHNLAAGSLLLVDGLLFGITGHGVDEGHVNIPSPLGPSFVAFDQKTGELAWESALPADKILHGSWSNPTYAELDGVKQVMFPGGDGWLYSFDPKDGELIWKFDLNPKGSIWELGGAGTKNNVISTAVVYNDIIYIGVGQDPEHGEGDGNLWAIDAKGKKGDITATSVVWHRGGEDFHRTMSTAAIKDDVMYIADLSGFLYALDAKTGQEYWTYDAFAAVWGSAFVADGMVFLGDEDGDIAILKEGKKLELLGEINMGSAVYTTPVAKDGVLYVVSRNRLFALENGIAPKPKEKPKPAAKPEAAKEAGS